MSYVRYIEKTREYYLSEGYGKPYRWAHHEEIPFAPMKKPLSECRVSALTSGGISRCSAAPFNAEATNDFRVEKG